MSHNSLLEEVHISKIEIQNEVKTSVYNLELQKASDKLQINRGTETVNKTLDTDVNKGYDNHGHTGDQGGRLPMYWVQFNMVAGKAIPPGGGAPLSYEPDRNYFVRIVFAILTFMLALTAGFVIFVRYTSARNIFIQYNFPLLIVGSVGLLALSYAMSCCACSRTPPMNFICLFLAVCFMSILTAAITVRYKTEIVMLALLTTVGVVILCLGLACSSFDFTRFLLYFIVIAFAFGMLAMVVGLYMLISGNRMKPLILVILIIGTLLNVVFLVMELQMVLGGRSVELSEDDYALGAFMLYTSIVEIFLNLVQIFGLLDNF